MLSFLVLFVVCLASIVSADTDPDCNTAFPSSADTLPTTITSCTLFYTPSMPTPIGPTGTVYATTLTSQFNVVDCKYCQISNVVENPVTLDPVNSIITSDSLAITQLACVPDLSEISRQTAMPAAMPEPTALISRSLKASTLHPVIKKNKIPLQDSLNHIKRQAPSATDDSLVLSEEPLRLIRQLFTVLYSIGVVNSGADLVRTCTRLRSANAILDLAEVGLNATQAAAIVCGASGSPAELRLYNQTLLAAAAAGLYGVQIAANYTGTVDASELCNQLELESLNDFGVDIDAVQEFICSANNGTTVTASNSTMTTSANVTSTTAMAPFPLSNSTEGLPTSEGSIAPTAVVDASSVNNGTWGGSRPGTTGMMGTTGGVNGTDNSAMGTGPSTSVASASTMGVDNPVGGIVNATGNASGVGGSNSTGNLSSGTDVEATGYVSGGSRATSIVPYVSAGTGVAGSDCATTTLSASQP